MKYFLQKNYFYLSLLSITLASSMSYAQSSIGELLSSSGILPEKSTIVAANTYSGAAPLKVPYNAVDPIDTKSYSKMHHFQRLDDGWALASPTQEIAIFQHEIKRLEALSSLHIDHGPSLKKGMSGPRVKQLAQVLNQRGFLESEDISDSFSEAIENAVKTAQKAYGLTGDGVAGAKTINALSAAGDKKRLAALYWALNNPRMSIHSAPKVVTINLPAQELRAYENGILVLTSRVIVGKKATQTPVMSDFIESVTFNPIWNIPPGIAERSYNGERRSIAAGPENPLGKIRIDMPNPDIIYLHHTNQPSQFSANNRLLSSGCVRVEKVYDLAQWLLGNNWNMINVDEALRTNWEQQVKLAEPVPVFIEYRPVEVSAQGIIRYHSDPYMRIPNY